MIRIPAFPLLRKLKGACATGAMAFLAACTVTGPAQVASLGPPIPAGAQVAISAARDSNPYEAAFAAALARELAQRSIAVSPDGNYVIQYGLAQRDATVAVAGASQSTGIVTVSEDRRKLLLDECPAQRLRLSVTILDRKANAKHGGATLDVNGCEFSEDYVGDLAGEVATALSGS